MRNPSPRAVLVMFGVVTGVLTLTAGVSSASEGGPDKLSMLVLPPLGPECIAHCEECELTPTQMGHEYYWVGVKVKDYLFDDDEDTSHDCSSASCAGDFHEECNGGGGAEEDLEAVTLALKTLEGAHLQRLLERNPDRILWNSRRRLVQIMGCGEQIILSVQMKAQQAVALSDS